MICRTRSGSALAITGWLGRRSSSRDPCWSARGPNSRATSRASALRSTLSVRTTIAPGVELGEVEEVGGQLRQPLDLLAHRAHELGPLLGARVLVLEQLDEAAEAEDRRPQLVRGVGDELLAGAVELGQAALHFVEGAGQLPELARVVVDRDAAAEVAVGDLAGRLLEPGDPAADDLGAVAADREGDDEREQAADRDLVLGARVALRSTTTQM